MDQYSAEQCFQMVLVVLRQIPIEVLCEIGLSFDSLGYFEDKSLSLSFLTEANGNSQPAYIRKFKKEYENHAIRAIRKILTENKEKESALKFSISTAIYDLNREALSRLRIGLETGTLAVEFIPVQLLGMFKLLDASNNYAPKPEFKNLLVLRVSEWMEVTL